MEFEILGQPMSKANSRQLVKIKGRMVPIKSKKALAYLNDFTLQCPKLKPLMEGDLVVHITIWYASRRPDLDESLILDAMQGRIYENDRQVKEKHIYGGLVDRDNPRCRIKVEPR